MMVVDAAHLGGIFTERTRSRHGGGARRETVTLAGVMTTGAQTIAGQASGTCAPDDVRRQVPALRS
jgi:hypothetical protein